MALAKRDARLLGQPPSDTAEIATAAWRRGRVGWLDVQERRAVGTVAVVKDVYPLGFTAGRAASVAAVAAHIATAANTAVAALDSNDQGAVTVRELLDRLTEAADGETRASGIPATLDRRALPMPRSFLEARSSDGRGSEADRIAHAASVAWNHGYEDGWTDGYWAANRIVNTVRHDERVATTQIAGIPTLTWLDQLAESARRISDDKPPGHPARLATLAGAEPPPEDRPRQPYPHTSTSDDTRDKRRGPARGM